MQSIYTWRCNGPGLLAPCRRKASTMSLTETDSHGDVSPTPEVRRNEEPKAKEEDIAYPGHLKFGLVFAALCLSVFQVSLVSIMLTSKLMFFGADFWVLKGRGYCCDCRFYYHANLIYNQPLMAPFRRSPPSQMNSILWPILDGEQSWFSAIELTASNNPTLF